MNEAHIEARSALADAPGSEAHALGLQPGVSGGQIVDPQTDVVQCWSVNPRGRRKGERLHQIELHPAEAATERQDGFIDVLGWTREVPHNGYTQEIHPQRFQFTARWRTQRNLLQPEYAKGPG